MRNVTCSTRRRPSESLVTSSGTDEQKAGTTVAQDDSEAALRIAKAAQTNSDTLNLSGLGLEDVPEGIGALTNLTELHLNNNKLTVLPESLGALTDLTILWLDGNRLSILPESLGALTNLTQLYLNNNKLTVVPEWLGFLINLNILRLDGNRLSALPESLGALTNLTRLDLDSNELTVLPEWLGALTNLTQLFLNNNGFRALPGSLGALTNLTTLWLQSNRLSALPESFGSLTNLARLDLEGNELTVLPERLGGLTNLTELYLNGNELSALPESFGSLADLITLWLDGNRLTVLPESLGALTNLTQLRLDDNPWITPPSEVCAGGSSGVLAFLRSLQQGAELQWLSKMLVVGEAAVGKTSVTKALCGLPYDSSEPQTHGVHIDPLHLEHPDHPDVRMELTVWDFGGQLEYRATQRFYLTDRSVFLLVWNSRRGWRAGGQVEAWLQAITTAAPGSPIIIVATHCKKSVADLDETSLRSRYPRIAEIHRVDCEDDTGIDALRAAVARQAANLPLMGARWPTTWTQGSDDLAATPGRTVTLRRAEAILDNAGLDEPAGRSALLRALHDRGQILHIPQDPQLRDHVILRPEWVDAMITHVLDSQQISDRGGLLSREHRAALWHDLDDPALTDMLTALMERFDLAYRIDTPDHDDIALVVERLPAGAPDHLPTEWTTALDNPACREIKMTYRLGSRQAGIPSWFIAREHRFTTGTAWARGVLLRHHGAASPALALLTDDDQAQPALKLTVRGTEPHTFYSILNEAFTSILAERYPGLAVRQMLPCPCAGPGQPECANEFAYSDALRMLERERNLQCNTSGDPIDPRTILLGLRALPIEQVLAQMNARLAPLPAMAETLITVATTTDRIEHTNLLVLEAVRDLLRHRDEQGTRCPGIFTVTKTGRTGYELQLYCEHSDAPHPLPDGAGIYQLTHFPAWLRRYGPYLRGLLIALKYAVPLATPILTGIADQVLPAVDTARLDLATALLDDLPALPGSFPTDSSDWAPERTGRSNADFTALRAALFAIDPDWGGLRERELPENRGIAYLCYHHRQALRYPAHPEPDVPEPLA
jgi:internalin A